MNVFSRYLIRHLFLGFAAAAGLLLPLFTTFNLINELDDVSPGGYRWTQAVLAVPFTFSAPRSPGMGSRLAVGVIVGLLTWISYQIMVNLGLLFALSAPVAALGLPMAFVLAALILVYLFDRQH
ncbi:hypothetical protein ACYUPO_001724 [Escherichia coli]